MCACMLPTRTLSPQTYHVWLQNLACMGYKTDNVKHFCQEYFLAILFSWSRQPMAWQGSNSTPQWSSRWFFRSWRGPFYGPTGIPNVPSGAWQTQATWLTPTQATNKKVKRPTRNGQGTLPPTTPAPTNRASLARSNQAKHSPLAIRV